MDLTAEFWRRRQALEIAIHRYDGQAALAPHTGATPDTFSPELGVAILDELFTVLASRIVAREDLDLSTISGALHVRCTDIDSDWTLHADDGKVRLAEGHSATSITGPVSDVALFLYGRTGPEPLQVIGDSTQINTWRQVFTL